MNSLMIYRTHHLPQVKYWWLAYMVKIVSRINTLSNQALKMTWQTKRVLLLCLCSLVFTLVACDQPLNDGDVIQSFLSTARGEGIISEDQLSSLLQLARKEGVLTQATSTEPTQPTVFWRLYNQFTLLNVVYFSGALLIMGAYTLFMTLAFERFSNVGLSVIVGLQAGAFGSIGLMLWGSDELQFVGGL